jgi:protein ImuB
MSNRYACLVVPSFPVAAILRTRPDLRHCSVAVVTGRAPALIVVDADASTRRAGVVPAMPAAEAQARVPGLTIVARSRACEASAQAALLDVALGVSPRAEDGGDGVVCLDLTGLSRLHPDERRVAQDLAACAEGAGLPVSVAIASTRVAARLAASANSLIVIPRGREAGVLSALPLALLAASDDLFAVLTRWGIRTLGELAALPNAALTERLGVEGRRLQRRARGEDLDPFVPYQPPAAVEETLDLEWPIENLEALAFVLSGMLDRLIARLTVRGWLLGAVHLGLGLTDRSRRDIPLSLAAPLADSRAVLPLLVQAVRPAPLSAAVERVTLQVEPAAARVAQAALFSDSLVGPDQLAATLARLEALVGREHVGSPVLSDSHRSDAFVLKPFEGASSPQIAPARQGTVTSPGRRMPVLRRLRPPAALAVETATDGSPRGILDGPWKGAIRVVSGPWRSCGEWWGEAGWRSEEWDAELANGSVLRLVQDLAQSTWSVEGIYD